MSIREYIESGVLEIYVLGLTDEAERAEVEKMAAAHPEIRKEIAEISVALQNYAEKRGVAPHPAIKPLLMATIDYTERLENGEAPAFPQILND
nr:hypothetical protein [Bacteroidota bacterium]